MSSRQVIRELKSRANAEKAAFFPRFFKSGPGEYGAGDKFLGVVVPDQRRIARDHRDLATDQVAQLLASAWHEARLTGLFILVGQFERAHKTNRNQSATPEQARRLLDFYVAQLDQVNNWDLVDCSAHKILGVWLRDNPQDRPMLYELANSQHLWRERVSLIATLTLIRERQYEDILILSEKFLGHEHDLIHKAAGWMLREVGKRDLEILRGFLLEHAGSMPRTMLRYAIEKMSRAERSRWLNIDK